MKKIFAFLMVISMLFIVSCDTDSEDTSGPKGPDVPVNPNPDKPWLNFSTWSDYLSDKYKKPFGWDAANGLGPLIAPIAHDMLAEEYFHSKGLNAGWNLGNTYDLNSNPRALSTNSNYNGLMTGLKAAGFNVIRIPSSWGPLSTSAPVPPTAFMDDIDAAIKAAHAAGLVVFINTHHNKNFFQLNQAGDSYRADREEGVVFKQMATRVIDVWATIAERFNDYGDWLIFESLNEPTITDDGGNVQWDGASLQYMRTLNHWNQVFVDTVRDTGGNNAKRYLIFKSYAGKLDTSLNVANEFRIPDDPAGTGRLIYSFHSYVPQPLGLEGQATDWDEATHGNSYMTMFNRARENYLIKGIPVFMGETGATFHSQRFGEGPESGVNGSSATANRNRLLLLNALGSHARTYGVIPCLWDNGEATRAINPNQANQGNPNGETFAMFRRKPAHDNNVNNYGLPIDHTKLAGGMFTASTGGAAMNSGNTARGDNDFGKRTVEAFIDAVNGKRPYGQPRFDPE